MQKGTDLVSSKYNQSFEGAKGLFEFYNSRSGSCHPANRSNVTNQSYNANNNTNSSIIQNDTSYSKAMAIARRGLTPNKHAA